MRFYWVLFPLYAASLLLAAVPAFSQTVPSYQARGIPLVVGIGPSSYDVDWGHGRMLGGTIWADWYPKWVPPVVHGLGVEFEARDISLNRGYGQTNMRQDTIAGGPVYTWRHYKNMHPYFKYLIGYGSMDFAGSPGYSHDTRTLTAPGGGLEYRIYRQFWARADYEYQTWQKLLGKTPNPQGFTAGVSYDFGHPVKR
jgi:hypothetical protein